MQSLFDTILHSGTIVNQDGRTQHDVGMIAGRIAYIGSLKHADAREHVDCTGLHILPGVIDTQVHFREPGLSHKEDLESGSRAAVMGGVTAVFEMPNTNPLTVDAVTLAAKVAAAHHRMHCDFAFWVGGTHENTHLIPELEQLQGSAGIKVFMGSSTGSLLVEDDEGVEAILRQTRRRAAFHSEDEAMLRERAHLCVTGDPSSHPVWRSVDVALNCTKRLIRIAEKTGARIHILHISTADEMDVLKHHKDLVSCEVTPHHLTLAAPNCYEKLGTYAQMNPPVRDKAHRAGIWAGLQQGIADVLGSDHAPHTHEDKQHIYPASHSGMTGVQTLVPIMLNHINEGRLSLERFVDMTSAGPARLFSIAGKGRIAVGYDADFTIIDLRRREAITNDWIQSKCGWTPYDGVSVKGWPVGTFVRGKKVMWQGQLVERGQGEAVRFNDVVYNNI